MTNPVVYALPGWGFGAGVFDPLRAARPDWNWHYAALPGHGQRIGIGWPPNDTEAAIGISAAAPVESIWLGWSLGGTLMLHAVLHTSLPNPPRALVLIAATPRFTAAPDWAWGVAAGELQALAGRISLGAANARERFTALLARAEAAEGRMLRASLRREPAPDPAALRGGLAALARLDLREALHRLGIPTLWLFGARDPLVEVATLFGVAGLLPPGGHRCSLIADSGHAPFLSGPGAVIASVERFLDEIG